MKKYLWIKVKETVSRHVGFEIGKDISEKEAKKLLKIIEDDDEFSLHSKEYSKLHDLLGNDISDTDGFTDVQIYEAD